MADFFISYNHKDEKMAEWVAYILEETGYKTIIQAWDFEAGQNFVLAMDRASQEAERVIPILSHNFFKSDFTPAEWAVYFAQDPTGEKGLVVPIRIDDVDVKGLLGQIVYIDANGLDEDQAEAKIISQVKKGRKKPPTRPTFPQNNQPRPNFPMNPDVGTGLALSLRRNDQLPPLPEHFVGREDEIAQIVDALKAGQDMSVVAAGGMGKSALASVSLRELLKGGVVVETQDFASKAEALASLRLRKIFIGGRK